MELYLLFAAYLILFAWLVTKTKFFTNSGLSNSQLVILFLLKVMAGIFYGWIGIHYGSLAKMIDTWVYHIEGLQEEKILTTHPIEFFTSIFKTYQGGYARFFSTHDSWWNDIKANFFIKILAIFDVLSFGNYYINVIFYSFISFFGPIAVFRIMKDVFPTQLFPVLIASFLVPSFLYWTSGLHKEGFIFLGLSLMLYQFYFGFKKKTFTFHRIIFILLGLIMILISRNFLVVPLLPPLLAWFLCQKIKTKPLLIFSTVFFFALVVFFAAKYISPSLDFPQYTVTKQQEFLKLEGNSSIPVKALQPGFASFFNNAPQAFSLAVLRPYPSDVRHLLSLAAASEVILLLIFFVIFLFIRKKGTSLSPFLLFCIFFSFGILIMIGYSVNNLGAIVRYRSIVFPLLLAPMAAKIDWNRIGKLFININNK